MKPNEYLPRWLREKLDSVAETKYSQVSETYFDTRRRIRRARQLNSLWHVRLEKKNKE